MKKMFTIVKDNAKSLRARSSVVENITQEEIDLVNKMHDYLVDSQDEKIREKYHLREGVGLAAPQIGKNIRALVVYYTTIDDEGNEKVVDHRLINPKVISESVRLAYLAGGEGCLSVDDEHQGYVYRKNKIIVKAYDVKLGKENIITAYGYEAIVLQHELDHLDGILFYDHIDKKDPFKVIEGSVRL
jgi:peptide deformylase